MVRTAIPLDPTREEALLWVAARHFAAAGYDGASLNQVIAEAGWAKSSFYHYFADKRALHEHVVRTLAARLIGDARTPEVERLTADDFWPAMADLLAGVERAATASPETWFLGEMFHRDTVSDQQGQLRVLRVGIARWLGRAVVHGRAIGVIRDDIPDELIIELTTAVLNTLDRWAVRQKSHSPDGPGSAALSLGVIRDLIGKSSDRSPD